MTLTRRDLIKTAAVAAVLPGTALASLGKTSPVSLEKPQPVSWEKPQHQVRKFYIWQPEGTAIFPCGEILVLLKAKNCLEVHHGRSHFYISSDCFSGNPNPPPRKLFQMQDGENPFYQSELTAFNGDFCHYTCEHFMVYQPTPAKIQELEDKYAAYTTQGVRHYTPS